jgi:hypothetical protein
MSQLSVLEFTHPDILSIYPSILALSESTKNDTIPFDSKIIIKLLVSFQDHINFIAPRIIISPDFRNILYTLVEEQVSSGFIISHTLKQEIENHRKTMKKNQMELQLQKFLIYSAKI